MSATQTFTAASDAERSRLLPPARCRSAPAAPVTDQQLDYLRVQGGAAADDSAIFPAGTRLEWTTEPEQIELGEADRFEGVSWLDHGQLGTALDHIEVWDNEGGEEGASKCQEALKEVTELAEEIAAGVAEMRAAEDDWKHMDACRLALQGLVFYALWTASGTTTDALTKANLRTMNSHWWFVECVYGWEDLSKALPPTHAPWVPFYRFIGPTLTAKIHCALESSRTSNATALSPLTTPRNKSRRREKDSVRTVLKQFADERDVEAVLELLPKSWFSGEYMTDEEMMAELRESLEG